MSKKECPICGKKAGLSGLKVKDGKVCGSCGAAIPFKELTSRGANNITIEEIRSRVNHKSVSNDKAKTFDETKRIGKFIAFDDKNRQVMLSPKKNPKVYDYEHISSFELLENGESVTKGGLGRALVGGVMFGGAGAVVGGVTGKRKNKEVVDSMRIKLNLKDIYRSVDYINFLDVKVKKGSLVYKDAYEKAQDCLSTLQFICDQESNEEVQTTDSADEIMKCKNLLDAGAITEEEYNQKKKKLLGI